MSKVLLVIAIILSPAMFGQYAMAEVLKADNIHARTWNAFVDKVLSLHKDLIKTYDIKVETKTGGYAGRPNFYLEERYIDKKTGKLISQLQWEKENPSNLHTIEVYVRDDTGRVLRDYMAAYLPDYRNAPTQTLLSIHGYNDDLHAFRTFDASGDRILDRCTGTTEGREINIMLDEDEIYAALDGYSNAMEHSDYKTCFTGLISEPGKYLNPQ